MNFGGEDNGNVFYPIGYHNVGGTVNGEDWYKYGGAFSGTFDGNGHTISGIYQNTWVMKGDYSGTYYNDAMGLFGYIYGGTVKNLTIDNFYSEGEFAPTGCVAAYAAGNATFENIAITSSHPQTYNTGVAGIVGWDNGGDTEADKSEFTFRNITVDDTNTISALWGSWDVAAAGLLGSLGEYSTATLDNCHVAATIDVYNDVCGNYQYYWYRYCGMMIGTVNKTKADGSLDLSKITAKNCTANFGDRHEYYYCEFVKNSIASYTHDYQFSRIPHSELNFTTSPVTCTGHDHESKGKETINGVEVWVEDKQAVYIPFKQLFGGYGWGVDGVDEYENIDIKSISGTSEIKFESTANGSYTTGTKVAISDLFTAKTGLTYAIDTDNVQVFVSPADEDSTAGGTYVASTTGNWENGTLTFTGAGAATVTITDYYFCNATTITVMVEEPKAVDKFEPIPDVTLTHTVENGTVSIKLDEIFKAKDGAEIDSSTVEVSVTGFENYTYTSDASDWTQGKLEFAGTGTVTVTITDNNFCNPATATVTITEPDSEDKFGLVFEHTDDFLYRVGNQNDVALGLLFKDVDDAEIGTVSVTVEALNDATVSGEYTKNTDDWTQGKIQFKGTGVVKVTIDDDKYAKECTLYLEVVDAENATSAKSASANNVVLLKNVNGGFSVSGGHTLYGNGFTVTLPTTVQSKFSAGFVGYATLNGGNLDNVRIEGPVYPEMYIYREQAKDSTDSEKANYFYNSIYINGGNCTISNSYISGSRTALCIRGGNNVVIENTTLSGGAYANMQVAGGSSVTLRDLTTVQTDVADSYGKGKTAHGLGIAVDSDVVDVYIEGELNQYNWLCGDQWDKQVPSAYQSSFPDFFGNNKYSSYWHYLNGGTDPYVNLAFVYACNWDTSKIHDERTTVDYETCNATIAGVAGGVYSKVNTVGGNAITDDDLKDLGYTSPGFNPVAPVFDFDNTPNNDEDDANDAADTYCVYDETNGTLKIGVTGDSKVIDLSNVTISKDGTVLTHTAYLNDTQISSDSVTIKAADGAKQALTFKATSNDAGYDKDGAPIEGSIEYTWTVTVEIATLAYPAPVWNMGGTYKFDTSNCVYAYYATSRGYGEAVPIYEGIKVNYYDKSGNLVELDLSGTTIHPTGSNNLNSNAFTYTLADGSTLTMKFSSGWKNGATTHQFTTYDKNGKKVYIYPQSLDNDGYIRAGVKNQDFDVKITYTFTDPNGQSTEKVTMNWYNAKASNDSVKTVQWKTFDSTNGKEPSCVTPDTLVTLADGSQKRIDEVTYDDQILVWDFVNGKYTSMPSIVIRNHGIDDYRVLTLNFSDGTKVNVIGEHGFFDVETNEFVMISENNVDQYIGNEFMKKDGDYFVPVVLDSYSIKEEYTASYSILTAVHYNCVLGDMFTLTPNVIGGNYFMPFEVGKNMTFDAEKMQADIEKYGLFTYEEFADFVTAEQFYALNAPQVKVAVGKGIITMEELMEIIDVLIPKA